MGCLAITSMNTSEPRRSAHMHRTCRETSERSGPKTAVRRDLRGRRAGSRPTVPICPASPSLMPHWGAAAAPELPPTTRGRRQSSCPWGKRRLKPPLLSCPSPRPRPRRRPALPGTGGGSPGSASARRTPRGTGCRRACRCRRPPDRAACCSRTSSVALRRTASARRTSPDTGCCRSSRPHRSPDRGPSSTRTSARTPSARRTPQDNRCCTSTPSGQDTGSMVLGQAHVDRHSV